METDLHISSRLRKLLPPMTAEEKRQLKENIEADGEVTDPILYWHDGVQNVVIDGMNRWEIVRGTDIPHRTSKMNFASYEDAEIWILNHQLGRRNLLEPAAIRRVRGELYNRLKAARGGDKKSQESNRHGDGLIGDAAQKVAEISGVSPRTVERDGARVNAMDKLTKAAKAIAERASDMEVRALAKLDKPEQDKVARSIRTGESESIRTALKLNPTKSSPNYGKCPNCAGTKWDEDEEGVSCAKCHHPHGEPVGDPDPDWIKTQRQKTIKTVEALMRAFDDLQTMVSRLEHDEAIQMCKKLLKIARCWK